MPTIEQHYRRLRRKGWRAQQAMHEARTYALADMIGEDFVRVLAEYDDDYAMIEHALDFDGTQEEKERVAQRINDEGIMWIQGQYRVDDDDEWETVDSIGGFVGDDWQDSGYDADILQSAINAYIDATKPLAAMLQSEGVGL